MKPTLPSALSAFGAAAKAKLANPGASAKPEDKAQWEKFLALPNLRFTAGPRASSLSASIGKRVGVWCRKPPLTARDLARISARLCRLLRDEVTRQLALKSEALTGLAADWRKRSSPTPTTEPSQLVTLRPRRSACSWPARKASALFVMPDSRTPSCP
jgi:hypothetical protein